MRNLLKSLHYVSTNLAEIRLNLYDATTKYPNDTWKNVENMLAGANHTIETAMAEMYSIEEMALLKNDIKTPPFTQGMKKIIQATEKLNEKCNEIDSEVNKWGRKRVCDVDDDM